MNGLFVHHPTPSPMAPSAKLSADFRARLLSCRHCEFLIGCCNIATRGARPGNDGRRLAQLQSEVVYALTTRLV